VDIFTKLLRYWNKAVQNIFDPAHNVSNTMKDVYKWVGRHDGIFNAKRKAFSRALGRTADKTTPAWANKTKNKKLCDGLVSKLVLPTKWPRPRYIFEHINRLSTSEAMMLAGQLLVQRFCSDFLQTHCCIVVIAVQLSGPLGAYILQFVEIDDAVKKLLVRLTWALESVQAKEHTTAGLAKLEAELVEVLALLESVFPIAWCSQVKHMNLHLCATIRKCGPHWVHSMLGAERFHTFFKKLCRGSRNVLV
jgi:hypothetical protein